MNTFFTVWFLINGVWHANVFDGWSAIDLKTPVACQAAVRFAEDPQNRMHTAHAQMFTCESNASVRSLNAV